MGYHGRLEATYSSAVSFKESMEAIMLSTILVIVLILILRERCLRGPTAQDGATARWHRWSDIGYCNRPGAAWANIVIVRLTERVYPRAAIGLVIRIVSR